jgi:hypothetical protein
MKGLVIGGGSSALLIRQKHGEILELGELLLCADNNASYILQVIDLTYGSQLTQQHLELISGLQLEEDPTFGLVDKHLRSYVIAKLKPVVTVSGNTAHSTKSLPSFMSEVRAITADDVAFLVQPNNPLLLGDLRSGSKPLPVPVSLPGRDVISHHVLISATTGKGKSNLTSFILWNTLTSTWCGLLVLDPHDEYYGHDGIGLKDHPSASERMIYYTPRDVPPGGRTLKIKLDQVKPWHLDGVMPWSDAQREALAAYVKCYGDDWIESALTDQPLAGFMEGTLAVVKRRLTQLLDIRVNEGAIECNGVFDRTQGATTLSDITNALDEAKTVIVDTSEFAGQTELLIGSLIAHRVFGKHHEMKMEGTLAQHPVVGIVLEEAPRVLGKDALERGPNIFSTIAREGRKFGVGLVAITQLPSLIPRDILANMNTKIILGTEMKPERQAIIESAAQDLSDDDRTIASLDKGEAIVTSNFGRFALPIKVPLLRDVVSASQRTTVKRAFFGVKPSN